VSWHTSVFPALVGWGRKTVSWSQPELYSEFYGLHSKNLSQSTQTNLSNKFIYLCQHGVMDIYFTLWFILHDVFCCSVAINASLSVGSYVPLPYLISVCVCFSICSLSQDASTQSLPQPWVSHCANGPWLLLWDNGVRSQDLDCGHAHCYWGMSLLDKDPV
jgi:hypothetical protein